MFSINSYVNYWILQNCIAGGLLALSPTPLGSGLSSRHLFLLYKVCCDFLLLFDITCKGCFVFSVFVCLFVFVQFGQ